MADTTIPATVEPAPAWRIALVPFAALMGLLLWAYWSSLSVMAARWGHDPQYSHGYIVPLFAVALLWMRRDQFPAGKVGFSFWGIVLLLAAIGMRLAAALFYVEWVDSISIIPSIMGVVLLCLGWPVLRWSWSAIAFLFFMIPLPHSIETALRGPLRRIGTISSTYVMQTVGLPVYSEGNVIVMDPHQIGVAEACSGLRMLVIFFALSTAVAMLSQRAWWERLLIVLSAVPIALISNVARITVTGILYQTAGPELAEKVFHDLAGWLMMPFGLALLGIESWLLARLIIVEHEDPIASMAGFGKQPAMAGVAPRASSPAAKPVAGRRETGGASKS